MSVNEKTARRIAAALPDVCDDDEARKLRYIARQISPAGLAKRSEDDQSVTHLIDTAEQIIKRYTNA